MWDAVAVAIPVVPGSYTAKGVKAIADKVTETKVVGNIVQSYSHHVIHRAISKDDVGVTPKSILDTLRNPKQKKSNYYVFP